jgi:hypothetical protein
MATSEAANMIPEHERDAEREQDSLKADHPRDREARVGAMDGGKRQSEQQQAEGGEADADPLATGHLQAEGALGHDREQDDSPGEYRLDDRQGRHRHCGDMEDPRPGRDREPECERPGGEQRLAGPQRVAVVDVRRLAGAAVLEEEADVRGEGADEGQHDANDESHEGRVLIGSRTAGHIGLTVDVGTGVRRLESVAAASIFRWTDATERVVLNALLSVPTAP